MKNIFYAIIYIVIIACRKLDDIIEHINQHYNGKYLINKPKDEQRKCKFCEKYFFEFRHFFEHLNKEHRVKFAPSLGNSIDLNMPFFLENLNESLKEEEFEKEFLYSDINNRFEFINR